MNSVSTNSVLNQLVALHHRSLAMYLSFASPTWILGDDRARDTLQVIALDQQQTVDRLGELLLENNGAVNFGAFPMEFTGYHDLSFSFLLKKLIEGQRRAIMAIEKCVSQLALAPWAKAVAEESLGASKGHLESLLELRQAQSLESRL